MPRQARLGPHPQGPLHDPRRRVEDGVPADRARRRAASRARADTRDDAGPAVNDGQWHTVQCVKTSSQIKVVVDGRRSRSRPASARSPTPTRCRSAPAPARSSSRARSTRPASRSAEPTERAGPRRADRRCSTGRPRVRRLPRLRGSWQSSTTSLVGRSWNCAGPTRRPTHTSLARWTPTGRPRVPPMPRLWSWPPPGPATSAPRSSCSERRGTTW